MFSKTIFFESLTEKATRFLGSKKRSVSGNIFDDDSSNIVFDIAVSKVGDDI